MSTPSRKEFIASYEEMTGGRYFIRPLLALIFTAKRFVYFVIGLAVIGLLTGIYWFFLPIALVAWGIFSRARRGNPFLP